MARRVVGEERGGEVGRVEAEVVTAGGPAGVDAVAVALAVARALPAGVSGGAGPLAAVVPRVPPPAGLTAVVLATDQQPGAVLVGVAVARPLPALVVRLAAVVAAPAGPIEPQSHLDHDGLLTVVRRGVLQEGELRELARLPGKTERIALARPVLCVVVEAAVGALQAGLCNDGGRLTLVEPVGGDVGGCLVQCTLTAKKYPC